MKRLWCWEGLGAGGEGENRGWDGWMASPTWLTDSEWTPGVGDGQGGLACCDSWDCKESDMTEQLNWTELKAHKFTNEWNFPVLTSHDVSGILNSEVQSDNGSVFKAAVTQGVSKALGLEYHTVPGDPNLQKKLKRLIMLKDIQVR